MQSKNHTGRNAVHKDHANRIKKASRHQTKGLKGVRKRWILLFIIYYSDHKHTVCFLSFILICLDGPEISTKSSLLQERK